MSSVRQKEVNNVFVHHECECTSWLALINNNNKTEQTICSKIKNKFKRLYTAHLTPFLLYVTVIVIIEVNCQSVGILRPEIFLSFTLSLTGQMRVTLLWAEKSLHFIKINTPDISTNVQKSRRGKEQKTTPPLSSRCRPATEDSLGLEVIRISQF